MGVARASATPTCRRAASGEGAAKLRSNVVGTYEAAGFPRYTAAADGYPETTDVDRRMLIAYGANADRYEDWLTKYARPLTDSQQPGTLPVPPGGYPNGYPASPLARDAAGKFLVTGQVGDAVAAHSGADIPLSAYGLGATLFGGTIDNSDVHFLIAQACGRGGAALTATTGVPEQPAHKDVCRLLSRS